MRSSSLSYFGLLRPLRKTRQAARHLEASTGWPAKAPDTIEVRAGDTAQTVADLLGGQLTRRRTDE